MFYDAEPMFIVLLLSHPILILLAWIYLYATGKPARDMVFWGVIALLFPYLGALSMFLFYRLRREKTPAKHS